MLLSTRKEFGFFVLTTAERSKIWMTIIIRDCHSSVVLKWWKGYQRIRNMLERRRSKQVTDENPDDDPFVIVKYCGRYAITGEIAYTNSTINILWNSVQGGRGSFEFHFQVCCVKIICTSDFCANKHILPRTSTLFHSPNQPNFAFRTSTTSFEFLHFPS